jgi:broad specificity phosphatase PhoE
MKLYFARHGQTDANANVVNNRPAAGDDEPLNDLGTQQAAELAENLKDEKFDIIISSPFKRATQTAEIINQYHGALIDIDNSWREIQTNSYLDLNTWNDLFNFDNNTSIENAEPLVDFFKRIYEALDELVAKNANKSVLVVSHGGVQHAVHAYANKLPLTGDIRISPMKNCECRIYELGL